MNLPKFLSNLPFGKKEEEKEYFFALNIGQQTLEAALWGLDGKHLKILQTTKDEYSSLDEIIPKTDKMLDSVLGSLEVEPQKILFGVLDSWLSEDDLKEEYLRLLRNVVKELELSPMAYVATSHAIIHFLENKEGVPTTSILVGFEEDNLIVTVCRAGKLDGSKVVKRSDDPGLDIEKALLNFAHVETLPSKIFIYGQSKEKLQKLKADLLSFSWMSKLSFLHFPKIDILDEDVQIKSICLAGGKEVRPDAVLVHEDSNLESVAKPMPTPIEEKVESGDVIPKEKEDADLGFITGDVAKKEEVLDTEVAPIDVTENIDEEYEKESLGEESAVEPSQALTSPEKKRNLVLPVIRMGARNIYLWISILVLAIIVAGYLTLPKATVKIFVEPQILEKDAQITADPNAKVVDENAKIIPAQIVQTEISGSGKGEVTGKKEVGDPAKGKVVLYNKTSEAKTLSKGTQLASSNGLKFSLDKSVTIASQSASESGITFGKENAEVTALSIGPDSNLPSASDLTVSSFSSSQVTAKAEGNFSGGNSKQVTVVSEADQDRLLATVASELRKQAQQKLQEGLKDKKILEEALSEEVAKKSFNKNINDQASELSLNLTVRYKGAAFEDKDLKLIVSKLVTTDVPEGFELNLSETETQADVSKMEKDGKLVFLARFRAKLMPKLDLNKLKNEIKGKTPKEVEQILKKHDHILGSEVTIKPSMPSFLQRLPILGRNIQVEVGLK